MKKKKIKNIIRVSDPFEFHSSMAQDLFHPETPAEYDKWVNNRALGYVAHCLSRYPSQAEPRLLPMIGSLLGTNFGPGVKQIEMVKGPEPKPHMYKHFDGRKETVMVTHVTIRLDCLPRPLEVAIDDRRCTVIIERGNPKNNLFFIKAEHPEFPQFSYPSEMGNPLWWSFLPYMRRQQERHLQYQIQQAEAKVKALQARLPSQKRKRLE